MPHALSRAFLPDLGGIALERDGGRIFGSGLVVVGSFLVGRVCAVSGGEGACRRGSQGGREQAGAN